MKTSCIQKYLGKSPKILILEYIGEWGNVGISKQDLFEGTGISRPTINKIVKEFEKEGMIKFSKIWQRKKIYKSIKTNPILKQFHKLYQTIVYFETEKYTGVNVRDKTKKKQLKPKEQKLYFEKSSGLRLEDYSWAYFINS